MIGQILLGWVYIIISSNFYSHLHLDLMLRIRRAWVVSGHFFFPPFRTHRISTSHERCVHIQAIRVCHRYILQFAYTVPKLFFILRILSQKSITGRYGHHLWLCSIPEQSHATHRDWQLFVGSSYVALLFRISI